MYRSACIVFTELLAAAMRGAASSVLELVNMSLGSRCGGWGYFLWH